MFPPWAPPIWQSLAHAALVDGIGFARLVEFAQDEHNTLAFRVDGLFCDDCYPSPYPWPGPLWVRPSLLSKIRRRIADLVGARSFDFQLTQNAVESALIKTINRGSVTCENRPLSSWHFVRPLFQPVLRTTLNVAASAHLAARLLARRLALIRLPAQLLAALAAWFATTWAFADNLTSGMPGETVRGRYQDFRTIMANSRGGFFDLRHADGRILEGRQCSRRY